MEHSKEVPQKLKDARHEILAILKKYDLAGIISLHSDAGWAEYAYDLEPSYSIVRIPPGPAPAVRIKSNLQEDHGGDRGEQAHKQEATANMIVQLQDLAGRHFLLMDEIRKAFETKLKIDLSGKDEFRPHTT